MGFWGKIFGDSLENNEKETYNQELFQAIANMDIAAIKSCLDKGANINAKDEMGETALNNASINGNVEIVKLLLNHNADINLQGRGGYTPLICACIVPHPEIVTTLIKNNADINSKEDRGLTALDFAEDRGYRDIAHFLTEVGGEKSGKGSPCCSTCQQLSILPGGETHWCVLRKSEVSQSYLCVHFEKR